MRIFNWEKFNEAREDKLMMPLYTSSEFYSKISKIRSIKGINDIANAIKNIISKKINLYDITCITFNPEVNDEVSFIQTSRIKRALNIDKWDGSLEDELSNFYDKGRTTLKIGRFIKKILPDVSDKGVEIFVNLWKASFSNGLEFKIVKGKEIVDWYQESKSAPGGGSLNNSCMRNARFLEIYETNTDIISMLILVNKENQLLGRALLWNLSEPEDKILLDRIYTVNDSDVNKFINYAIENDFIYKSVQSYGENFANYNGHLEVQINKGEYKYYPYMDTMFIYDPDNGLLLSDPYYEYNHNDFNYLKLRDTQGLPTNWDDAWDDYNECGANSDNLSYCVNINGYCNTDDAIFLDYLDEYYAPNEDVAIDGLDSEYYLASDMIMYINEKGEEYSVFKNNIVDVIINLETNELRKMHRTELNVCKVGTKYYLKELCMLDKNGVWIASTDSVIAYLRKDVICSVTQPSIRPRANRFEGAYMTKDDSVKYNKPIFDHIELKIYREDYEQLKWVDVDSDDVPINIKRKIESDISNGSMMSMYYKNFLYKKFGCGEKLANSIKQLKEKMLRDNSKFIDDTFKNYLTYSGKYEFELRSFFPNDPKVIQKTIDDDDKYFYMVYTKDELIDLIINVYSQTDALNIRNYTLQSSFEKLDYGYDFMGSEIYSKMEDFIDECRATIKDIDQIEAYKNLCKSPVVLEWYKNNKYL